MIYDVNGNQLSTLFDVNGNQLSKAYDVDGNEIWGASNALKVMSFNVGSWYGYADYVPTAESQYYYDLHEEIFEDQNADVAGIQEYCSTIGNLSALTLLEEFFNSIYAIDRTSNPAKAGKANASKFTLSNNEEIVFTANTGEVRSFLKSTFQFNGKTIYFLNAHLALTSTENIAQIQELLTYVADKEYWILTGDFNVRFDNAQSDAYQTHIKPFLDLGYHVANGGDFGFIPNYYTRQGEGHCVDNIYTSANIDITDVYADETKLNATLSNGIDHIPLIAEIEIN